MSPSRGSAPSSRLTQICQIGTSFPHVDGLEVLELLKLLGLAAATAWCEVEFQPAHARLEAPLRPEVAARADQAAEIGVTADSDAADCVDT
jgi:hypothetical protein